MEGEVIKAIRRVCYRLRGYRRKARKWACHIRFQDVRWQGQSFAFATAGFTNLDKYVSDALVPQVMYRVNMALKQGHKIRGIGLHTIEMLQMDQLELFFEEDDRFRNLSRAADCINNTYGIDTIDFAAAQNGVKGNTHFVKRV